MNMYKGRIRWYNKHFGYGFITHWDGRDIFVHYSVVSTAIETLKENQTVHYECVDNNGRLKATKVETYVAKENGKVRRGPYRRG